MADKHYKINFTMSDGTTESVPFVAPQGEKGEKGDKGDTGAQGIQGIQGVKGDKGDPFEIAKVYESVAAMNAGYANDGVKQGQFVIIETGNINDEENAKLYIKGTTAYEYLTDMSGATGLQGPQGERGPQGIQGEQGIPGVKGDKGDTGSQGESGRGITSVTIEEVV